MQKDEFFRASDDLTIIAFLGSLPDVTQWLVREKRISEQTRYCRADCFIERGFFALPFGQLDYYEVVTADSQWRCSPCMCNGEVHECHEKYPDPL